MINKMKKQRREDRKGERGSGKEIKERSKEKGQGNWKKYERTNN